MQATQSKLPSAVVVSTVYGPMILNRHDINQTNSLFKHGRSPDHLDIEMLLSAMGDPAGRVVVDVGANFGAFTLAFAHAVGGAGQVHAFEPQRMLFNMLAGTVALNGLTNTYCYPVAVGRSAGFVEVPSFDHDRPMNFGSVEFGPVQREPLDQTRRYDLATQDIARVKTLDQFSFHRLDLLKVDVEGMELDVVEGARQTIVRHRPILFVEFFKCDAPRLAAVIQELGYEIRASERDYLCMPMRR